MLQKPQIPHAASVSWRISVGAILVLMLINPAMAHHVMGGTLPSTFGEGLLSGLGHPIIGLDHLAFVVGVGLVSLTCPKRFLMPLAFIIATIAGTAIHLMAMNLPFPEIVIALSVATIGVLLISQKAVAPAAFATLFAIAGLFHGYAYGESIVGAEAAPLSAYLLGFAVIQYAIVAGVMEITRYVGENSKDLQPLWLRVGGGIVAGIGLVFLTENLI